MKKRKTTRRRQETKNTKMEQKQIHAELEKRGIKHIKVGLFDVDGVLRGKYINLEKFQSAVEGGMGFCDVVFGWDSSDSLYDNVQVTGWHTGYPDSTARVDPATFRIIPWEPDTALFLLDLDLAVAPRTVLKRVIDRAHQMSLEPYFSAEYEYFFFRETSQSVREKGFRRLTPFSPGMFGYSVLRTGAYAEFLHTILDSMRAFDVELESFHTETGPGVYETAIRYDTALRAADKAALFKTAIKEIAARNGLIATFMAKWNTTLPGCGGHLHQSLWSNEEKRNLFFDASCPHKISPLMRHYIAGQLALMPEVTALICPTVNSYKRLVPGTWAPTAVSWGIENRTTALRAIPAGPKSTRVEYRLGGADGNPYLTMAAALATGLHGIERKLEPPPAVQANAYQDRLPPIPATLAEATGCLKGSAAMREWLGQEFVEHFVATREWELRQFQAAVTDWEMERYFEII